MKLQLVSDLHLELQPNLGRGLLSTIKPAADRLVLAGDITTARYPDGLKLLFDYVSARWKHVVYVPGNHEFYGTNLKDGWDVIKNVESDYGNVYALNNEAAVLSDSALRVFGGTGWFPDPISDHIAWNARRFMSDFAVIRDIEAAYRNRKDFEMWMHDWPEAPPDVVVTHHLPVYECVAPRFAKSALNAFFVSRFDVENCSAKLWLHGHTHSNVDVTVGQTRVVANPRGYEGERARTEAWDPGFTVDLREDPRPERARDIA